MTDASLCTNMSFWPCCVTVSFDYKIINVFVSFTNCSFSSGTRYCYARKLVSVISYEGLNVSGR